MKGPGVYSLSISQGFSHSHHAFDTVCVKLSDTPQGPSACMRCFSTSLIAAVRIANKTEWIDDPG